MVEVWSKELDSVMDTKKESLITRTRGRIINKVRKEIWKIKTLNNPTDSDLSNLKSLEDYLDITIEQHKEKLSERYKKEFLDKKATFPAIVTVLPKGVALAIRKIDSCIEELRQSKTNKEKIFGVVDVLKSYGLLAATPVIFTAKFVARHWYLLLLLLNLPKISFFNKDKVNNPENIEQLEGAPEVVPSLVIAPKPVLEQVPTPIPGVEAPPHVPEFPPKPAMDNPNNGWDMQYIKQGEETLSYVEPLTINDITSDVIPNTIASETPQENLNTLFKIMKYKYKTEVSGGDLNQIYNTYDDALKDLTQQGVTQEEAVQYLNDPNISIRWLIGPQNKGIFETEASMMDELKNDEFLGISLKDTTVEEYVNAHQNDIEPILDKFNSASNIGEFVKEVGPEALALFTLYKIVQYSLAVPTGGLTLVLP